MGIAMPFAEGSGEHRIVASDAGDLREVVAAISGFSALARSRNVGRAALATALADLRLSCDSTTRIVARALLPAAEVVTLATGMHEEARGAVESMVSVARGSTDRVIAAVDDASSRGIGARARLNLERRCDEAAAALSGVTRAVEMLQQASVGQPLPITIAELLAEASARDGDGEPEIELWATGALDALISVAPRVGAHVLTGVVADAASELGARALSIDFERRDARVVVHIRPAEDTTSRAPTHRLPALSRAAYDPAVTALIAASLAAPVVARAQVDDARMHFPAA